MVIDVYDSSTPEPGYEDMGILDVFEDIDAYYAEERAYYEMWQAEQEMYRDMGY